MKKPKADYAIQTVTNALMVLDALGAGEDFGVTELAKQLALHKNNVFRILATLEQRGYVEQTADERYRLGLRALELGEAFLRGRPLVRMARATLENLAAETGETAHLAVLQGFEAVYLDGVATEQLVQTATRRGERLPLHATAAGKVLLSFAPQGVRESFDRALGQDTLPELTPETISDRHKFFEHLRMVTADGYATDLEECEVGLVCAAAPVFGPSGTLVAALSVSAPAFRLPGRELRVEAARKVVTAANALSQELGHSV